MYLQNTLIKLRWALFVTYTFIQSIMRSEMCSLHLTHPSGAVGSRHCGARGAVGGVGALLKGLTSVVDTSCRAGIRTHNLVLPRVSSRTLYPLGHDCSLSGRAASDHSTSCSSVMRHHGFERTVCRVLGQRFNRVSYSDAKPPNI